MNYARNPVRRLDFKFGVAYDSSLDVVFCVMRKMIEQEERFLKMPPPKIFVTNMSDSSVDLVIWVWVRTYEYYDLQRKYLRIIKETLDEHGIEIPFPQRVLHVKQEGVASESSKEREPDFDDLVQDEIVIDGKRISGK